MNIGTLLRYALRLRNKDKIPRLPWGMLTTDYTVIDENAARVMARLGARDPLGVQKALKRHKARDVDELVARLEHQMPRRKIRERLELMVGRLVGGTKYPPYRREIVAAVKAQQGNAELLRRIQRARASGDKP
jgi:hypothetical protein